MSAPSSEMIENDEENDDMSSEKESYLSPQNPFFTYFPFPLFRRPDFRIHFPPLESESTTNSEDDKKCGFLCLLFQEVEKQISSLESHVKVLSNVTIGNDKNHTSYTEEVLPDGTVVKVNKTLFSNVDKLGNSFFIQATEVHHSDLFPIKKDKDSTMKEDKTNESKEEKETHKNKKEENKKENNKEEDEEEDSSLPVFDGTDIKEDEIGFKIPENFNEKENEVSRFGIDDGFLN